MHRSNFLKSGLIVAIGVLLGRVSGFFRDILLAREFGATAIADGIMLILTLPDLLTGLFVGGALAAVMVPELQTAPVQKRPQIFWRTSVVAAMCFGVMALLFYVGLEYVLQVLAPGFEQEIVVNNRDAFGVSLVALPFAVLAAVTTAYLQSWQRYLAAAFGTLIVNMSVVAAVFWKIQTRPLLVLAYAVLVGAVLRWAVQLIAVSRLPKDVHAPSGENEDPEERVAKSELTRVWRRYVEALGAGSLLLLLPVAARSFASLGDAGSIAVFNYSIKLVEFPLNAVLTVFSTVLFPYFARFSQQNEVREEVHEVLRRAMLWVFFLAAAATSSLVGLSFFLRSVEDGYGALSSSDVQLIGTIALILTLGLVPRAFSSLHVMLFNSRKETWVPLALSLVGFLVFLGLIQPLQRSLGLLGVAGGLTAVFWILALAEGILLQRRYALPLRTILMSRSIFVSGVVFGIGTIVQWGFVNAFAGRGMDHSIGFVALLILSTITMIVGLMSFVEGRQLIRNKFLRRTRT